MRNYTPIRQLVLLTATALIAAASAVWPLTGWAMATSTSTPTPTPTSACCACPAEHPCQHPDPTSKACPDNCNPVPNQVCAANGACESPATPTPTPTATETILDFGGEFLLHSGAVSLNPFTLQPIYEPGMPAEGSQQQAKAYRVESGGTTANFYLEAAYKRRWAWKKRGANYGGQYSPCSDQLLECCATVLPCCATTPPCENVSVTAEHAAAQAKAREDLDNSILMPDDLQIRLGFVSAQDNASATAIAGSGDIYGEVVGGWNLFRVLERGTTLPTAVSLNAEFAASAVSDRHAQDIHWRVMAPALAIVVGYPMPGAAGDLVKLFARGGFLPIIEVPRRNSDGTVAADPSGFPEFAHKLSGGIDIEAHIPVPIPLLNVGYVVTEGTFNGGDPNPWAVRIGYALSVERLGKAIKGSNAEK